MFVEIEEEGFALVRRWESNSGLDCQTIALVCYPLSRTYIFYQKRKYIQDIEKSHLAWKDDKQDANA